MRNILFAGVLSLCLSASLAAEPKAKVLVSGLDNPAGVAVQPETGDVFVSDSAAGRILRVKVGENVMSSPVVTGYPQDVYGKGPRYTIGPLGLGFVDKNHLAVGDGGLPDGEEQIRVFDISTGKVLDYTDTAAASGPLPKGDASNRGEGNFYGIAVTENGIYTTANGDDTKGWVLKFPIKKGRPSGKLEAYLATKEAVDVDAPVGITVGPKPGELLIGQGGEINLPQDSLLTIYEEKTGKLLFSGKSGLYDIVALAISPKTGKLYALDFAWMAPDQAGLYELKYDRTSAEGTVTATKVMSLDKPTAMAFAPDGTLYVSEIGTAESEDQKPGRLIAVMGDL